ncbi:MAG: hypothetical protein DHS20C05_07480 [Hyphococcus sp.]|nr:MAG: hypothetical protein DHS20C05_07480 [Marinicaulis sp.]
MSDNKEDFAPIDGFEPVRKAVFAKALELAAFEGWTSSMLDGAAREAKVTPSSLKAAFPAGIRDLLRYWSEMADEQMLAAMKTSEFAGLKIREKVAFAVRSRLDVLAAHKEAARRAAALMALPPYSILAATLSWRTADKIWRGLGDQSTDFNFYSKRGILTGVWTSTFARWLADDSEDRAATHAFLNDRIGNVMQIEKAKARVKDLGLDPTKPIEWLARLRYPARR